MSVLRTWAPDLMLMDAPLLPISGSASIALMFGRTQPATDLLTDQAVVTVDVLDDAGESVIGGPADATLDESNTIKAAWTATITMAADLDPKKVYRVVWTWAIENDDETPGTLSGVTAHDAYPAAYPQVTPPVTDSWIALSNRALATSPDAVGWRGHVHRAWREIIAWTVRQRSGDLWTVHELIGPLEHLALHYIWRDLAAHGNAAARENAAAARTAYDLALKAVQLGWDEDGDGTLDKERGPAGSATDSEPVV